MSEAEFIDVRRVVEAPVKTSFADMRQAFHSKYMDFEFDRPIPAEFRTKNRDFWKRIVDEVWQHTIEMVNLCAGDLDTPKNPHVTSARLTTITQNLDRCKNETACAVIAWAIPEKKRKRDE